MKKHLEERVNKTPANPLHEQILVRREYEQRLQSITRDKIGISKKEIFLVGAACLAAAGGAYYIFTTYLM